MKIKIKYFGGSMKKRLFLPLLIIFSIIVTLLTVYAEELEQPTLPPNQTEASITEYNKQIDGYNNTIDEIYETEPIEETDAPASKFTPDGYWALINLILTILSIIFTILLIIFCLQDKFGKKKETEKEEKKITKRCIFSKIINILFSVILVILFILTQDMKLRMELVDEFTIITLIIFILQLIVFVAIETIGEKNKEERVDE